MTDYGKYLSLLSEKYPNIRAVTSEIINLSAIINLPKGTEHFMSDIHGEYEAFCHILNNCSGVIREKVDSLYQDILSHEERKEICTLIYYPKEKLGLLKADGLINEQWYAVTVGYLIEIARLLSSKYTRSKVRKAMPSEYAYIIDELLHIQKDEDNNQVRYHQMILDTIISIDADNFIIAFAGLIKRLAVDHLHIVGDIFDRGTSADKILDLLMSYHSLDIQWGNHDILWMGAASGCDACIADVVANSVKYRTIRILENGYGIGLRNLALFAEHTYHGDSAMQSLERAITVIQFKLEGQLITRHPEYGMQGRLLLHKVNTNSGTIEIDGKVYAMNKSDFPTLNPENPYELSEEESTVFNELKKAFQNSERLKRHISFLYEVGAMYHIHNGNLLYHGCVPMTADGEFEQVELFGKLYSGKALFELADSKARHAFFDKEKNIDNLDFMWYLWKGRKSPLCGRNIKSFERAYIDDQSSWSEEKDPYYTLYYDEKICDMILSEFGLSEEDSHIINGHTPVRTTKGELPVRSGGKLFVIDGGFCERYHQTTGIAGYTLIFSSHGLSLTAHHPFESVTAALTENRDIHSDRQFVETKKHRLMIMDTDVGRLIKRDIEDLYKLMDYYRDGTKR